MNNFSSEIDGSAEKRSKYGDPKRALAITLIVIVIFSAFVARLLWKREVLGITGYYTKFYPTTVLMYIDGEFKPLQFPALDKFTGLKIRSMPDIITGMFDYRNEKVNQLIEKTLGDNFSFGVWNYKSAKRTLAIFEIERKSKVQPVFETIFKEKEKPKQDTLRGFKVVYTSRAAYFTYKNLVFLADSRETLTYVIDNYILKTGKNLYSNNEFQKIALNLDKDRAMTFISSDFRPFANSGFVKNSFFPELENLAGSLQFAAASLLITDTSIKINALTDLNSTTSTGKAVQMSFSNIFNENSTINTELIPDNTAGFVTFNKASDIVEFFLRIAGMNPASDETKKMVTMITGLDLEKEIIRPLKGNATIIAIGQGSQNTGYLLTMSNKEKADLVLLKLLKTVKNQLSDLKEEKISYNNTELTCISSENISKICFGKYKEEAIMGEKAAIISYIDKMKAHKMVARNFSTDNSGALGYININNSSKYLKGYGSYTNALNKVLKRVNNIDFSIKSNNNVIKSSFNLNFGEEK